MSRLHNEENNSCGEKINSSSAVPLSKMDLRSFVPIRSFMSLIQGLRARETEVCELQVKVVIEEHVIRLQITMTYTLVVHVLKNLNNLFEVISGNLWREGSSLRNEVEELPVLGELQNQAEDALNSSICLMLLFGIVVI